ATLWRNVGQLLADPSSDPNAAREAWEHVLLLVPGDAEATRAMEGLQRAAQAAVPSGPSDEKAKLEEQVRTLEAKASDPKAALEKLARGHVRESEIARALAPVYETSGDHQRRAASLLVQLSTTQDKAEQKHLIRALAELNEKQLMDGRAALSFWVRGLAIDPL